MSKIQPDFWTGDDISVPVIIQAGTGTPIPINSGDTIQAVFVRAKNRDIYAVLHTAVTLDLNHPEADLANGKVIFELTSAQSIDIPTGLACVGFKSADLGRTILSKEEYLIAQGIIS